MIAKIAAGFAAAMMVASGPVHAAEPEVLQRVGKWQVNYETEACHLSAIFGEGSKTVIARFTKYAPGDSFKLALYGGRFVSDEVRTEGTIDFGLAPRPDPVFGMNGTAGKYKAVFLGSMRIDGERKGDAEGERPSVTPEQEAAVTGVKVALRHKRPFRLAFGSLAKPMELMRNCTDDLVRSWGYDPKIQSTLSRDVRPKPGTEHAEWITSNDYPAGALMMGQNGMVQFRLDIDETGKIAGCHVLARSNPDAFADATCRAVTKRAKLDPALDAQGKPVKSYIVQAVNWLMAS